MASTQGRFHLVVLPAYSPQLNPDEWVWKNLKHDRVGRTSVKNREEFITLVRAALRRLQRRPRSSAHSSANPTSFREPDLVYITAA